MPRPLLRAIVDRANLRAFRVRTRPSKGEPSDPIRAELLSIERLEQEAEILAVLQRVRPRSGSDRRLVERLRDNGRVLQRAYRALATAVREGHPITPAAEWLIDHFHDVESQVFEIIEDLPPGYYRQLPKLADGENQGYPRVFGLACSFVAHTDSRFDLPSLSRFVLAYQRVQPFTIGELWAVNITLRIVLIENLRRMAEGLTRSRADRLSADVLADRLLGIGRDPEPAHKLLEPLRGTSLPSAFAVQLLQRLRDQDPRVTPALVWLEEHLAAHGTTTDEIVQKEHQAQGATHVTVRNVITSLRLMASVDWKEFFESVSVIDAELRAGSAFAGMDFPTRDQYRRAIEELSRGSRHSEIEVARRALLATREAATRDPDRVREQDPGYYLVSKGRAAFEAQLGARVGLRRRLGRAVARSGIPGFVAMVVLAAASLLALPLLVLAREGVSRRGLAALGALAFFPAMEAAVALVNRALVRGIGPTRLPGMALRDGVDQRHRTIVVVPTMLTTRADLDAQIEHLEVHHLASDEGDLCFALLSDWRDAPTEHVDGDDELLQAAREGIERLNRRHGPAPAGPRFLLLHRRRIWNPGEGKFIGWERKRGKLHELNRLLRGATDTSFVGPGGSSPAVPQGVRYVITLDADTRLPRGVARRLIGKMAHPLNAPRWEATTGRVMEGHAVLQPRVTPSLPADHEGSLFQRVFSGATGMDPYAFAVSDVYQDIYGEGTYSGKGIYDLDVFEAALAGRIPESTVLSHDLLEGTFARAALVSDVEVVEEFPSRYDVDAARHHRWARGDWQLLPWLFGPGPAARGGERDGIPLIGRWKMLDNLRRSVSSMLGLLALVGAWTLPVELAAFWSAVVVALLALPALHPWFAGLLPRRAGISMPGHLRAVGTDLVLASARIAFQLTCLTHQAWLMADAIARTLIRLGYTRRNMLEWVTAAQSGIRPGLDVVGAYRQMFGAVALALLSALFVALRGGHDAWMVAAPFLALWGLAPAIARAVSLPRPLAGRKPIGLDDSRALRLVARRTWRYFETFVTAGEHMLPPDNFQEEPNPVVAHRTSPTNLGLYLLSVVAARDFGWLGTFHAIERLEETLATMNTLERFRGHFYNWYATEDLRPLDPKYVSAVDSGNLAGHLIALANACRELVASPVFGAWHLAGLEDGLRMTRQALSAVRPDHRAQIVTREQLDEALAEFDAVLRRPAATPLAIAAQLLELAGHAETLRDIASTMAAERTDPASGEVLSTVLELSASIHSHQLDASRVMPWTRLFGHDSELILAEISALHPQLNPLFSEIPTLGGLSERCEAAISLLEAQPSGHSGALIEALSSASRHALALTRRLEGLAQVATRLWREMEFDFLLDADRQLLSIGYAVAEERLDGSFYDLLASEARLTSFVAIAKGDVPLTHWFRLGRAVTPVGNGAVLLSWSGSMFEYLMPALVMSAPVGSHLDRTMRLVVACQRKYGAERQVPWGISESAYNARDLELTYQYSNFGIPMLGLKRGLGQSLVVAPYATALAAMFDPAAAVRNLARLAEAGGRGWFGWYEALDYTPSRVPTGKTVAVVTAYMAHHQGMTLVAIANAVLGGIMRARFHAEPMVQATELLLQERAPRDVVIAGSRVEDLKATAKVRDALRPSSRKFDSPHDPTPRTHLLSNGGYAVMLTSAGSGYSRCRDLEVTRWREDVSCDPWGSYFFLRESRGGHLWSAGYQPTCAEPDRYEVRFSEDRAEISRLDGVIETTLDVVVSPESDAEVRRVSITNTGTQVMEIDVTSYAEVVLAPRGADAAHPAFAKLFVSTEFDAASQTLLATRRRRSPDEVEVWAAHLAVLEGEAVGEIQFETDRARFLGRGHGLRDAVAVSDGRPLSNTVGTVLDPIFSLRHGVRLLPGATARIAFWTLLAPSRSAALDLADKHRDAAAFERTQTLAWTQAQVQLHHLGVDHEEAHLFQRLANHVLYADAGLRPFANPLGQSELGPRALWAHGVSGDLPIVLCRIDEAEDLAIVRQLLQAHTYWRMKQLAVDLVFFNEKPPSYNQDLQSSLEALVRANQAPPHLVGEGARGSVFVLRRDLLASEVRSLLLRVARAVLLSRRGSLSEQLARLAPSKPVSLPAFLRRPSSPMPARAAGSRPELEFFNGLGGFADHGREYVTILGPGQWTPAPWINVIANATFGFQTSVEGGGYTWAVNCRENQLTPWSNDPVSDPPGEVMYLRDEDTGDVWGPTALPIRPAGASYVARFGQGYTRFEHTSHDIALTLLQYVPLEDPVKISRLTLRNLSGRPRRLTVTAFVEWVLGASRSASASAIVTEIDPATGAMLARNPWSLEYGAQVAFMDLGGRQVAWTGDRTEFLGRNGSLANPVALALTSALSNRVGAGLDPCGVLQGVIELKADSSLEVVFLLGEAPSRSEAIALVTRYRERDLDQVLGEVKAHWDDLLGVMQVKTPDRSMDLMLNRWLLYQTLVARVWARGAFYQASGAYGFRDQLQDMMALAVSRPAMVREHLLRSAARQFQEGDVQHWWLPRGGQGVRTRMSDDRAWLPYAVAHYLEVTGDLGVLDELVPFLEGPVLREDERETFFPPEVAAEAATLFEHCARALDACLAVGSHGLPLMGTGDWNDGMNLVGAEGKGESVWLGWFLITVMGGWTRVARERGEQQRAEAWDLHAAAVRDSLEREGWDGDWYRRGYFDDGTPLGSILGSECQIDSIAQSWAVLSGAAQPARSAHAMAALADRLVRPDEGLVLLFDPPFDHSEQEPGYIKGYPAGIRENGGQYTHAAVWSLMAFATLGDGNKASQLFSMLNPINHASTREGARRYKVEPYVVAADVYSQAPHVGRGGWTWYTGSAGWLHRAGLESILGVRVHGAELSVDPCIPRDWPGFEVRYRQGAARLDIQVENPRGVSRGVVLVALDGVELEGGNVSVPLREDGETHHLRVVLG